MQLQIYQHLYLKKIVLNSLEFQTKMLMKTNTLIWQI